MILWVGTCSIWVVAEADEELGPIAVTWWPGAHFSQRFIHRRPIDGCRLIPDKDAEVVDRFASARCQHVNPHQGAVKKQNKNRFKKIRFFFLKGGLYHWQREDSIIVPELQIPWLLKKAILTSGLLLERDLRCWGAWDTTCRHEAKDTTPWISWRREAWKKEALGDLPWKYERERERDCQLDEHWNCFRGDLVDISERPGGAHIGFSERIDTILSWTELNWN